MQARSNGTKRPAMLDYEADCNKSVSVWVSSDLFVGVTSAGISGTLLWYIVGNIPHLLQSDEKLPLCLYC